jgi:succinate dehydrogenase / fumarate reductase, flavoprotein subunit
MGCEIIEHSYDVVIVGAGARTGSRPGNGIVGIESGLHHEDFPTRSHGVAAQGGMAATLGNMGDR